MAIKIEKIAEVREVIGTINVEKGDVAQICFNFPTYASKAVYEGLIDGKHRFMKRSRCGDGIASWGIESHEIEARSDDTVVLGNPERLEMDFYQKGDPGYTTRRRKLSTAKIWARDKTSGGRD